MADVKCRKKEEHLTLRVRACSLAMFVLVVLALARPSVAGGPPPIPPTFDNLHYDSHWQQKLDLYIPAGSPECGSWPVVIFIFGGGWLTGDETQVEPYVAPLMSRGFAIAAISYRVSGQAIFPAQIHDCKAAVRWLRANAATYALDPDRLAVFGDSAGAHLAALLGTSAGVASLEGDVGGNLDQPSNVQVVGDFAGPIDLIEYSQVHHSNEVAALFGYRWWFELPLGDPEFFALIQSADPAIHATGDDPPFRIVHGNADSQVPFSNAVYLHDTLVNVGVPSAITLLPGVGHSIPDSAYEPVFDYFVEVLTPPDSDDDGVPDACDGCPNDPNKIAPGICGCGTPDADSDGDGVANCLDGCPNDPNKIAPGICGCGTPDTDSDGDGVANCLDGCPNDPNKIAPGICGCGTPDTDSDGDGVANCLDGCPNDPNKIAPGICGCGTPDTDSDGDGVANCLDGCPNDPNKIAPGICGCGTPDTDSDSDGVANCIDGCPNDPDKIEPGVCGCGEPDLDTDDDGVPDCLDACPLDPLKIAPGQCGCGSPDTDTDDDGVADCLDNCDTLPNIGQADCDDDGTGDACAGEPDCNANGVPDSCDIASRISDDSNGNTIPDECECAANVDNDGTSADQVDVDDLIAVILGWGACEMRCPPYCAEDVDHDCQIGVDDLIAVIIAWGPCP